MYGKRTGLDAADGAVNTEGLVCCFGSDNGIDGGNRVVCTTIPTRSQRAIATWMLQWEGKGGGGRGWLGWFRIKGIAACVLFGRV